MNKLFYQNPSEYIKIMAFELQKGEKLLLYLNLHIQIEFLYLFIIFLYRYICIYKTVKKK